MILCIGQQHPITVYWTSFGVCVVLVLCSGYYFLDRILFHHDFHHDYHWDFYGHPLLFGLHFRLSVAK